MLSRKFLAVRRFAQSVRNMSGHGAEIPERYKHLGQLTMDSYPLPTKSHLEVYNRVQAKFNKHLVLSALSLTTAISFVYLNDTFAYLAPPDRKVLEWE